jgi:hypothetical protein
MSNASVGNKGVILGVSSLKKALAGQIDIQIPQTFGGQTEFGWGPSDETGFGTMLNFAALQAIYPWNETYVQMLVNVLGTALGIETVEFNLSNDYNVDDDKVYGYIDHQSAACEGENVHIFDSPKVLRNFLFAEDSVVHLDNDNG